MIPDKDDMITFAETLEKAGERAGWDAPPALGGIQDVGDGYTSFLFPVQPVDIAKDGDVTGALLSIARMFMRNTAKHQKKTTELGIRHWGDGLAGLWFVSEAWMTTSKVALRDGRRIADLPANQRQEIRTCVVVDCGGRVYQAMRVRGEQPEVYCAEPGDDELRMAGNIPDGLRRMLLALGVSMTPGSIDMQRLSVAGIG